jgi:TatD DNase family protein
MLIDSHCHLDFPELAKDEAGVLARARSAGVAGMLTIGTRLRRKASAPTSRQRVRPACR